MTARKVLVVGMDGVRFDRLAEIAPPVLGGLMSTGAYGVGALPYGEGGVSLTGSSGEVVAAGGSAVSEAGRKISSRTDSGPGWSSVATGVWPDKHGVSDNSFTGAQFTKYPDFLTRAAAHGHDTYAIFSWTALDEHGAFGPAIARKEVLDGFAETFAACDRQVADLAARHLAAHGPDASFVYFGDTDEAAHRLGPFSAAHTDALLLQDAFLGRLLAAVRGRPSYADEHWTVLVTTDHGHVDEGGHGGVSARERTTFVIVNELDREPPAPLAEARLVDLAPTVLDRLGVAIDPAWELDGSALAPTRR